MINTNAATSRTLKPGQSTRIHIYDLDAMTSTVVYETVDSLLEAPNWCTDRDTLILNGDGVMWQLDIASRKLSPIEYEGLPDVNNDHVLSPDAASIFLSANDSHIYKGLIGGGRVARVTKDHKPVRLQFLHGVSPDGGTLAYIGLETSDGTRTANIYTLRIHDGAEQQLTFGDRPADGSEYSPDGQWIYFNTEQFSAEPGHAQLARMRVDGTDLEQLTTDERVNWFPHISPDGHHVVYLSYEVGTIGHPADRSVQVRLAGPGRYLTPVVLAEFNGGQGTINVNSWAPDSRRFAYVEYPLNAE